MSKYLSDNQLEMVNDLIEYIEESEAQDFREQCKDANTDVADLYDMNATQHIYQTASILRLMLEN